MANLKLQFEMTPHRFKQQKTDTNGRRKQSESFGLQQLSIAVDTSRHQQSSVIICKPQQLKTHSTLNVCK